MGTRKPLIIMVISFLIVALVCSSASSKLFAVPPGGGSQPKDCKPATMFQGEETSRSCCWDESAGIDSILIRYCQTCEKGPDGKFNDCNSKYRLPFQHASSGGDLPMLEEADPTPTTPTPPPGPRSGLGSILPGEGFVQEPSESTPPQTSEIAPQEVPPGVPGAEPPTEEEADQGTQAAPRAVDPSQCEVGNVWDPDLMICVPDVPPLELCPDGSLPQPTGPGGTQPECPSSDTQAFQAEEPEQTPEEEEPEQPEADVSQQPPEGDGSEESSNSN